MKIPMQFLKFPLQHLKVQLMHVISWGLCLFEEPNSDHYIKLILTPLFWELRGKEYIYVKQSRFFLYRS
jgi:hypothetical protein